MKRHALLFLLILSISMTLFAETTTIEPSDDMYSDAENPGVSPTITQLWTANYSAAGHFERIMIRFDLSDYADVELQSATLNLRRFFSCPSSGTTATTFYAIDQQWDEETWDHTQHIAYNSEISMPYVFSGTGGNANVDFNIDITDFLNNWIEGNIENYGFVIIANSGQKLSEFYSKEHANADYHPSLTLTWQGNVNHEEGIAPYGVTAMNFPNPFNPETTIAYTIPQDSFVTVDIFDARGRLIYAISKGYQAQGLHQITWNGVDESGKDVASGVYYYRISTNRGTMTRPMVLIK